MPTTRLPAIHKQSSPKPPKPPDPEVVPALSAMAYDLARLVTEHPDQQRPAMRLHATLVAVAEARACDMAARGYFSHVDPDGHGPNHHVRAAGYKLPGNYGSEGNGVESIAGGQATAAEAFKGWMQSPGHRRHLLGEGGVYGVQIRYGIGHCKLDSSRYGNYWVFVAAPEQGAA